MKNRVSSVKGWLIGLVVGVTVIVRYLLTLLPSYQVDMGGYSAWSLYLAQAGFDGFYQTFHVVYAPAYMYLLWLTGKITTLFSLSMETHVLLIKLWAVLSDLVGGYLIYLIGKRLGKAKLGFILGTAYVLNPAIFFNSSVWGQFDSIPATMLLGVIYFFTLERSVTAVILFALAVLTKPQSAMVFPVVLYLFFQTPFSWRKLISSFLGGLATYTAVTLPFAAGRSFLWIIDLYLTSGGDYPYATANGFNFWTLCGGQAVHDSLPFWGLTYATWSLIFLAAVALFSVWALWKKGGSPQMWYFTTYFLSLGVFFFGSRMHERYMFPALLFLTVALLWDRRLWLPLVALSLCMLVNQWYVYELAKKNQFWLANYDPVAMVTAIVTLLAVGHGVYYLLSNHARYLVVNEVGTDKGVAR